MKCPTCHEHFTSSEENAFIVFNGCCSNCLSNKEFAFNSDIELSEDSEEQ